jgi:hypothetical protein
MSISTAIAGTKSVLMPIVVAARNYPRDFLACLDAFYATERVHHFIGSGLACYAQFGQPRSPFLDETWVKSIAMLRRHWKEENRYHLAAIGKLGPRLLDMPFNRDPDGGPMVTYSPFAALSRTPEVKDLLIDSPHLDFLIGRRERVRALHDRGADETALISLLLTMHFASINASRSTASLQARRTP